MRGSSWFPGCSTASLGAGPNTFDTLSALEQWVEKGTAPDAIPATHSTNNAVDRTMPLCKFPEKAHYKGSGDPNSVSSWSCPQNDKSLLAVGPNGVLAGVSAVLSRPCQCPGKAGIEKRRIEIQCFTCEEKFAGAPPFVNFKGWGFRFS